MQPSSPRRTPDIDILKLRGRDVRRLDDDAFRFVIGQVLELQQADRVENQILFYQPVSDRAEIIHKTRAKVIGVGGGNGCQVAGSRVITERGCLKIEDVVIGDKVPNSNGRWNGTVTSLYRSPDPVDCYKVVTKRGYTFSGSADHLSMICAERCRSWHNAADAASGTSSWRRLDWLHEEAPLRQLYIAIRGHGAFPSVGHISEDDAYFMGLMSGNGHSRPESGAASLSFHQDDVLLIEWAASYLISRGIKPRVHPKDGSLCTEVHWCSVVFKEWLIRQGYLCGPGPEKGVPETVWRGTKPVVAAFVRGLMDTDGCATGKPSVVLVNVSEALIRGIHILLTRFGVVSSLRFDATKNHFSDAGIWRLEICGRKLTRYMHEIGFALDRKNEKIPLKSDTQYKFRPDKWDRISSIVYIGKHHVHGLTILPRPEYLSDGFLQHNSSKTESCLVEMIACATGKFPRALNTWFHGKFRGPIQCRIVVESLTTTLEPIILPKLQWWKWTGTGPPGTSKGHWGWIPKNCLIDGSWEKSYSHKNRMLQLQCFDPKNGEFIGLSTVQFMCLRGDQRVAMHDGIWKPVGEIAVGERVRGGASVTRTFRYEDAPLVRIKCRGGREIVSTPNHRHLMADGSFREAGSFDVGDEIAYERCEHGGGSPLKSWEVGWLAIMIGDGSLTGRQAEFTAKEPSRVLDDLPPLPPGCKLKREAQTRWRVTLDGPRRGNPLVSLLKEVSLWGKKSREKFVPEIVFRSSPESRARFVKHLWTTDGSYCAQTKQYSYRTISRRLAYDVKYLLWGLGVPASINEANGTCGFTRKKVHSYGVVVSASGASRLRAILNGDEFAHIGLGRGWKAGVVSVVEDAGVDAVYCIEVDDPSHTFICDGLVTHNSHDQDPSDFASGDFHIVLHDEPPRESIYIENEARTMRVNGRLMLAMTWPDDPAMPVDWIFDRIYDQAKPGGEVNWIELHTTENRHLDQEAIRSQMSRWSETERQVRIYGRPIRFSNLIHPDFTDRTQHWCFNCREIIVPSYDDGLRMHFCDICRGFEVSSFNHVGHFDTQPYWPVVNVLDPHPRKPHMMVWVAVDPSDDLWVVVDAKVEGEPRDVKEKVEEVEDRFGLMTALRVMDPNMGASPASVKRGVTWQDEFMDAGLWFDLADDSDVGRARVNEYLKPDRRRDGPRIHFHSRCWDTVFQMKRYTWDEHKRGAEKDQKQKPRTKNDDFPTMLKYLMNSEPTFHGLRGFGQVIQAGGRARKGARKSY